MGVETDAECDRLDQDKDLRLRMDAYFAELGYLPLARQTDGKALAEINSDHLFVIGIAFKSKGTVDRVHKGNGWYAMK